MVLAGRDLPFTVQEPIRRQGPSFCGRHHQRKGKSCLRMDTSNHAQTKKLARIGAGSFNVQFADYPGMIGKGYADLRDLPLGGT